MFKQVKMIDSDLDALSTDVRALINATAGAAEDTVLAARRRLTAMMHEGENAYERLEDSAMKTVKRANAAVHCHPYRTVGMALGLGLAIGAILGRRTD